MILRMATLAERITEAVETSKKPIADIARLCGVKVQSVYQWMKGDTKKISGENLVELAAATGYLPMWIAKEKGPKTVDGNALIVTDPSLINAVHALEKMPHELRLEQIRGIYSIVKHLPDAQKNAPETRNTEQPHTIERRRPIAHAGAVHYDLRPALPYGRRAEDKKRSNPA